MKTKVSRRWFIAAYILPALLVYAIFFVYPTLNSFYISLFQWTGFSMDMNFAGFGNFKRILDDDVILKALKNNLILLFTCTVSTFVLSLLFAAVIARKSTMRNKIYQVIYFIPYVLSTAVVSIMWMFIFNPSFGLVNSFLNSVGLNRLTHVWLGEPGIIMGALTVPLVWMNLGFYMILYIAAILNIPGHLYEAADIDGANEAQKFRYVTFPGIWEIIRISLVFFIVTAMNNSFEIVYVVTRGGPDRMSELLTTYLYENAFMKSDYGYASAIGVLLFAVTFILMFLVLRLTRRGEET